MGEHKSHLVGDRQSKLSRQLFTKSARTRYRNTMERRWLDSALTTLDKSRVRQEHLLEREISLLEEDLKLTALTEMAIEDASCDESEAEDSPERVSSSARNSSARKCTDAAMIERCNTDRRWLSDDRRTSITSLPPSSTSITASLKRRVQSAPDVGKVYNYSDKLKTRPSSFYKLKKQSQQQADTEVTSCKYSQSDLSCRHFPCCSPRDISTTRVPSGVKGRRNSAPPASSAVTMTAGVVPGAWVHPHDRLIHNLEMTSVRRPQRTSLIQTLQKEKSLKKILRDSKMRSARDYPADWCVNYGKPTSKRKLYTAARPTSMEDFKGIM